MEKYEMRACTTCIRGPERSPSKSACRQCDDNLHLYAPTKSIGILDALNPFKANPPECFGQYMSGQDAAERDCDLCAMLAACQDESPPMIQMEPKPTPSEFNRSGSKYLRDAAQLVDGKLDVYAVLDAFAVTCPARQHAIKKLLCSGLRGKGDVIQDLQEAGDAVARAIQMQRAR
jgi:hypothetical protein